MSLLNRLRNHTFWLLDLIKGRPIRKHYDDIGQILDNPNSQKSNERQKELLDKILNHAVNSVPFYSTYKTFNSLHDFPVINKNLIQENFDSFKSKPYLNKKKYKIYTSGSTGIPFLIFHDKNKKERNTAETIFFLQQCGYKIGERLFFFRLWKGETKSVIKARIQNIIKINVTKLDDDSLRLIIEKIKKDKSPKFFIGIASSFEALCKYLYKIKSEPVKANAISFIANSDALNDYTKKTIKKFFNAPIISRYSNEEQGLIAQQKLENNDFFYINWASYYIEIFKIDEDTPENIGETGRIIVTDLLNFCMPLIRYDTGDLGTFSYNNCGEKVFSAVEGRRMDAIYNTQGKLISSYSIYPKMQKYYDIIKQYQFIQKGEKEYIVKINIENEFPFEKELIEDIKKDFGDDANIKIIFVNEIPALSSGKQKKVLNLYHRTN
jgi:phenylacetate-CoA ligase